MHFLRISIRRATIIEKTLQNLLKSICSPRKMELSECIAEYKPDYVVFIRDYEQLAAYWQNGGVK